MKVFQKVTILGIAVSLCVGFSGCASGGKGLENDLQREDNQALEAEAAAVRARLSRALRLIQEGRLEQGRAIVEGILEQHPHHSAARYYWEKIQTRLYATVYPGDTLSEIAAYYYGDPEKWRILAETNGIESPKRLAPYLRLRIPWIPEREEGRDEAGRLQRRFFAGGELMKILIVPVRGEDTLAGLAKRYYGDKRLRFFIADYNRLEDPDTLSQGTTIKIPVFRKVAGPGGKQREILRRGYLALKKRNYQEAHRYFASIPKGSPYRRQALKGLDRCKAEGAVHYERLGDQALENARPREACRYWKMALRLDPNRQEVKRKLEEAEDLLQALERLPALP